MQAVANALAEQKLTGMPHRRIGHVEEWMSYAHGNVHARLEEAYTEPQQWETMSNPAPSPTGPSPPPSMTGGNWTLLGMLSLIWGSGFLFSKIAVEDIGPPTMVLIRVSLGSLLLYAIIRLRGIPLPRGWTLWRPLFVLGLLNTTLPFTLNAWGLTRIDSGLAGILTATVPIFTVMIAHFATRDEHVTGAKATGIAVGIVGVVVILGTDLGSLATGSGPGKLAILLSSLLYGISAVYARSLKDIPPMILTLGQLCTAAIWLLPVVLIADRPWRTAATWSLDAVLAILLLTVFGTVLAYLMFYRILTTAGATNASLVAYVIPVVAVALGALFLDERLHMYQVLGMILIIGAMALIDGRLVKRLAGGRGLKPART